MTPRGEAKQRIMKDARMESPMTTVIDLDDVEQSADAVGERANVPFRIWLRAWMPHHPNAAGAAAGVAISLVAALAWLTTLAVKPEPALKPTAPATHLLAVVTENATQETSTLIRRDGSGDSVSRGEILGTEPSMVEGLAGIAITVVGPNASCRIVLDNKVVDESSVPAEGGQTTCLWVAPTR